MNQLQATLQVYKYRVQVDKQTTLIEEEEMEKQVNDGTFDECVYVKDDDDLCA